jgi:hypothetical protein
LATLPRLLIAAGILLALVEHGQETRARAVDVALALWFVLTALALAYVAWDAFTVTPQPVVMKQGRLLMTVYTELLGAVLYVLSCQEPEPGEHERSGDTDSRHSQSESRDPHEASPSWIMSASNTVAGQTGRGAPPPDRIGGNRSMPAWLFSGTRQRTKRLWKSASEGETRIDISCERMDWSASQVTKHRKAGSFERLPCYL